jgi:ribonuclease J
VIDRRGDLLADPQVSPFGLPAGDGGGRPLMETIMDAVVDAIESLPRPRRKDAEAVREAVRRAVRAAVAGVWGKKPVCTVVVTVV